LPTHQESGGAFPTLERLRQGWTDGNTANLCIGQDPVLMTPLQVAVLTSAIANGGKVLWPRLVDRLESQEGTEHRKPYVFPTPPPRDELGVSARSLRIVQDAMLADVEEADGTGTLAAVPGLRICGKTGTAEVQDVFNRKSGKITWFAAFAPYKEPKYAVVVMVEEGVSGARTCAPIAGKVYSAILDCEREPGAQKPALAFKNP
jgi:cell division protein FtsI/penicillin-binding protein 2